MLRFTVKPADLAALPCVLFRRRMALAGLVLCALVALQKSSG